MADSRQQLAGGAEKPLPTAVGEHGGGAGGAPDLWADAYRKVESYFVALRIRNKLLLSRLVFRVLDEASRIYQEGAHEGKSPTQLAAEEADRVVEAWLQRVLDEVENGEGKTLHLSARGRLALLIADMPERWQAYFLTEPPWPEEFTRTMRQSYLSAGPDFQIAQMEPRDIDLGAVGRAVRTLENLEQYPRLKFALAGGAVVFVLWFLFVVVG